jgi:hypothetical protein
MGIGPCVSLAARRPVLDEHDSLVLGFGDAPVRDQAAGIELNLDLVLVSRTSTRLPIQSTGTE